MPLFLGLDPGVSGGLAAILRDRVELLAMPEDPEAVLDWLMEQHDQATQDLEPVLACLEKVTGYIPKESPYANHQPGSRMFTFGRAYGHLEMALKALGIGYTEVIPRTWQKGVGIQKTKTETNWKGKLKEYAQSLYPGVKVTLKTADALLLAHYCKRLREG